MRLDVSPKLAGRKTNVPPLDGHKRGKGRW